MARTGPDRAGRWRVDPPGAATIEPGGYLRPLAAGKVAVKAAIDGQEVVARIERRAAGGPLLGLCRRCRSHLDACWDATREAATARRTVRTAFIFPFSATIPAAITRRWSGTEASAESALLDPERSLFLGKATGRTPHGGGPRVAAWLARIPARCSTGSRRAPREHRGKSHGAGRRCEHRARHDPC